MTTSVANTSWMLDIYEELPTPLILSFDDSIVAAWHQMAECSLLDQISINLKDPVSQTRLRHPCRSLHCTHAQCFDYHTYKSTNQRKPYHDYLCPICNLPANPSKVYCDPLWLLLLHEFPNVDGALIVTRAGTIETFTDFHRAGGASQLKWREVVDLSNDSDDELEIVPSSSTKPNEHKVVTMKHLWSKRQLVTGNLCENLPKLSETTVKRMTASPSILDMLHFVNHYNIEEVLVQYQQHLEGSNPGLHHIFGKIVAGRPFQCPDIKSLLVDLDVKAKINSSKTSAKIYNMLKAIVDKGLKARHQSIEEVRQDAYRVWVNTYELRLEARKGHNFMQLSQQTSTSTSSTDDASTNHDIHARGKPSNPSRLSVKVDEAITKIEASSSIKSRSTSEAVAVAPLVLRGESQLDSLIETTNVLSMPDDEEDSRERARERSPSTARTHVRYDISAPSSAAKNPISIVATPIQERFLDDSQESVVEQIEFEVRKRPSILARAPSAMPSNPASTVSAVRSVPTAIHASPTVTVNTTTAGTAATIDSGTIFSDSSRSKPVEAASPLATTPTQVTVTALHELKDIEIAFPADTGYFVALPDGTSSSRVPSKPYDGCRLQLMKVPQKGRKQLVWSTSHATTSSSSSSTSLTTSESQSMKDVSFQPPQLHANGRYNLHLMAKLTQSRPRYVDAATSPMIPASFFPISEGPSSTVPVQSGTAISDSVSPSESTTTGPSETPRAMRLERAEDIFAHPPPGNAMSSNSSCSSSSSHGSRKRSGRCRSLSSDCDHDVHVGHKRKRSPSLLQSPTGKHTRYPHMDSDGVKHTHFLDDETEMDVVSVHYDSDQRMNVAVDNESTARNAVTAAEEESAPIIVARVPLAIDQVSRRVLETTTTEHHLDTPRTSQTAASVSKSGSMPEPQAPVRQVSKSKSRRSLGNRLIHGADEDTARWSARPAELIMLSPSKFNNKTNVDREDDRAAAVVTSSGMESPPASVDREEIVRMQVQPSRQSFPFGANGSLSDPMDTSAMLQSWRQSIQSATKAANQATIARAPSPRSSPGLQTNEDAAPAPAKDHVHYQRHVYQQMLHDEEKNSRMKSVVPSRSECAQSSNEKTRSAAVDSIHPLVSPPLRGPHNVSSSQIATSSFQSPQQVPSTGDLVVNMTGMDPHRHHRTSRPSVIPSLISHAPPDILQSAANRVSMQELLQRQLEVRAAYERQAQQGYQQYTAAMAIVQQQQQQQQQQQFPTERNQHLTQHHQRPPQETDTSRRPMPPAANRPHNPVQYRHDGSDHHTHPPHPTHLSELPIQLRQISQLSGRGQSAQTKEQPTQRQSGRADPVPEVTAKQLHRQHQRKQHKHNKQVKLLRKQEIERQNQLQSQLPPKGNHVPAPIVTTNNNNNNTNTNNGHQRNHVVSHQPASTSGSFISLVANDFASS